MEEINEVLKDLDERIEVQERYIKSAKQAKNEAIASLMFRELAAFLEVRKMIMKVKKKCPGSGNSERHNK